MGVRGDQLIGFAGGLKPARRARLVGASLVALALGTIQPAVAQDATWLANPGNGDFNTGANWSPATVPTGTASFDTSSVTALSVSGLTIVGGLTFNVGASNYSLSNSGQLRFTGAGMDVQGGGLTITNSGLGANTEFYNASTANGITLTGVSNHATGINFYDTSTAGSAHVAITSGNSVNFYDTSTAASASITNASGAVGFHNSSTAAGASITNNGTVGFADTSTAGSATITTNNSSATYFADNSSGGSARLIVNSGGFLDFSYLTSAGTTVGSLEGDGRFNLGSKTITVGGNDLSTTVSGVIADGGNHGGTGGALIKVGNGTLTGSNTYTGGTTINAGTLQIGDVANMGKILNAVTVGTSGALEVVNADTSGITGITINAGTVKFRNATSAGSAAIVGNGGNLGFYNTSSAATSTITNSNFGSLYFYNGSSAGTSRIASSNSVIAFLDTSTAGGTTILVSGGFSGLSFYDGSSAGSAIITVSGGGIYFGGNSTAGTATITNSGAGGMSMRGSSTAGNASITNNSSFYFGDTSTAASATIINNGNINFDGNSTAANATITNSSGAITYFQGTASGGSARLIANAGGVFDFSNLPVGTTAGSFEGAGQFNLGSKTLTVGGNGLSTTVSGVIADGGVGTGGALVKTGAGTLTLSGINTYTGATTVNAGVLVVNGSIATSSGVTVNTSGTLAGIGAVGATTVASGGTLAAGNGTAGSSLNVAGSLALQSGAFYMVQINPATSSFANVTGAATLGGATVKAIYANGSYIAKQYTILTAGSVSGAFASVAETNLPRNLHSTLSYDATHAYLNLVLNFVPPPGSGLSGNQNAIGNAIVNFFNTNGGISLVYSGLTASGLTQAAGETATGSQQTTFQAMTQFMGVMTDPFGTGRETGASAPPAFAANNETSYVATRSAAERDAYAMFTKAPLAQTYDARWNVWAAAYGGSQTTDGTAALGSNATTSRVFGTAVGLDYRFSSNTVAGFALAGGGTNFSVTGGGSGRSDLFQAGAFVRHSIGAAYLSGALAYGWQDVTTDRTVTIAGIDRLRAEFNANTYSGRVEGGYRFVAPWIGGIGLTPYAAAQFTTFDLPAYAEQVISGANTFALAYGPKSVTDARSELGLRTDKSFAMPNGVLTLRGRAAWAHDFNLDRAVGATFQALPGASFVVNGARQASDSALATASAEMKWLNGWSAAATFEGEFSSVTRSYAGKGVVRYAW